ncbi:MAG: hypothetical protein ACREMY_05140, partial [bacterium]
FTVRNVRTTHEQFDPDTARQLHSLYEAMIDFGAHPNQFGTLASTRQAEEHDPNHVTYQVGILHPEQIPQLATIRLAVGVAVGALKVSQIVFSERLQRADMTDEIAQIVGALNSVFSAWAPPPNSR